MTFDTVVSALRRVLGQLKSEVVGEAPKNAPRSIVLGADSDDDRPGFPVPESAYAKIPM